MFVSFLRKWKLIFLFLFLGGLYIIYPYTTLWSIYKAIQTHNTPQLITYLDWQSIKTNLQSDLTKSIQNAPTSQDDLPDFGNSFATTAISNAVDLNLTPDNLAKFINHIKQNNTIKDSSTIRTLLRSFMSTHVHFTSPFSLRADILIPGEEKDSIEMTLHLQNWRWKVTSFKFSEELTFQLFQQSDLK